MTQYSSPGFGQYPQQQPFVEQRTSVMAVLSLVFALICCPPGPSLLGVFFGVAALIAIGRSNDRLVGRGLAISGIIIGLIVCAIWLGITIGVGGALKAYQSQFAEPLVTKFKTLETGNYTEFRTMLTPEANAKITDADIAAFHAGYTSELGKLVDSPSGLWDVMKVAMEARDAWAPAQGRNDLIPLVGRFDNGPGIVLFQFDPSGAGQNPQGIQQFANIIISAPSKNSWTLWDPQKLPAGTPTLPPGDQPPVDQPGTPPAPPPETPGEPKTDGPG